MSLTPFIEPLVSDAQWPAHYSSDPLERTWAHSPRCDITEKDGNIHIVADIPGVRKEDVSVHLDEGVLTIKGLRRDEFVDDSDVGTRHYHRVERFKGTFERHFRVPEGVTADKVKAKFEHGLLVINLPNPKPKGPAPAHASIPIH
eukprot:comp9469_c0_seq2/m.10972 comp9469_c0_seq2/g.10972  ORF comp9469_c0_seq2/g.10972 comp9469_c0_seq2/m.10972 type:complete len:145 (-) comp9469_c0_seq2:24-458(-)